MANSIEQLCDQVDMLSASNNHIFSHFQEKSETHQKSFFAINQKLRGLWEIQPHVVSHNFAPKGTFDKWKSAASLEDNLFTASTRPPHIEKLVAEMAPLPDLTKFDKYRTDGKSCINDFSDPSFQRADWIEKEMKIQETIIKRKNERRRKKKVKVETKVAKAENVRRKIFLADGTVSYVSGDNDIPEIKVTQSASNLEKLKTSENEMKKVFFGKLKRTATTPNNLTRNQSIAKVKIASNVSTREKESSFDEQIEPPPVPQQKTENAEKEIIPPIKPDYLSVPPLADNITEEEEKPKPPSKKHTLPPIPRNIEEEEEEGGKSEEGETNVAEEEHVLIVPKIKEEKEIEKMASPPEMPPKLEITPTQPKFEDKPKSAAGKSPVNLLDSIRKGKALRKVEKPAEKEEKDEGLSSSIFMVLQRRAAIIGSDSEEESDGDEWDD